MLRRATVLVLASATVVSLCRPAPAQTSETGSVTGTGQVVLRPKATALRFQLVLVEQGDDMAATLKNLDRHGAAFRKALLAAKAAPESVKLDGPRLVSSLRALGELVPVGQYRGKGQWNKQVQQQQQQFPSQPPPPSPAGETKRAPRITLQTHSEGRVASARRNRDGDARRGRSNRARSASGDGAASPQEESATVAACQPTRAV